MAKKTTRISDIAKCAGVSPATVSLVLNNRQGISSAVVERVRQIAFEMGYHKGVFPSPQPHTIVAQICILLIRKHGDCIETQMADSESFTAGIVDYTTQLQGEHAVHLEIRNTNWDLASIQSAISSALGNFAVMAQNSPHHLDAESFKTPERTNEKSDTPEQQLPVSSPAPSKTALKSGLLVIATELSPEDISHLAQSTNLPCIFIDAPYPHLPYESVNINNTNVVHDIVRHLKEQGYQRLAYCHIKQSMANCHNRLEALRQAMQHYHLDGELHSIGIALRGEDEDNLAKELSKLKEQLNSQFPDAFICCSDIQAYKLIKALQDEGFRVPEEVAVVGFDNMAASSFFTPPLSSVAVPRREIGVRALKRLLEKMLVGEKEPRISGATVDQALGCRYIARKSSSRS